MFCAGSALLGGLHFNSMAAAAGVSVGASLSAVQYVPLGRRPVSIATDGIVPIEPIPVAVVAIVSVAVVAVSYSVIYQGSILVLTELADQLGFQS